MDKKEDKKLIKKEDKEDIEKIDCKVPQNVEDVKDLEYFEE